jgi:hypothetical protein
MKESPSSDNVQIIVKQWIDSFLTPWYVYSEAYQGVFFKLKSFLRLYLLVIKLLQS